MTYLEYPKPTVDYTQLEGKVAYYSIQVYDQVMACEDFYEARKIWLNAIDHANQNLPGFSRVRTSILGCRTLKDIKNRMYAHIEASKNVDEGY